MMYMYMYTCILIMCIGVCVWVHVPVTSCGLGEYWEVFHLRLSSVHVSLSAGSCECQVIHDGYGLGEVHVRQ